MTKGLLRSLGRAPEIKQKVVKKTIAVTALAMNVDGATGAGDGQVVIGDFHEGNILLLGAVAYFQFSGPGGDAGLTDTWAGDYSIGTTADAGDDLTGTDANIIPTTALAAATAEVSPRTRSASTATGAILDNTDGSLEINLNLLVDDANISADDIGFTVDGEIHIAYIILGDD